MSASLIVMFSLCGCKYAEAKVLFTTNYNGNDETYIMNIDGSKKTRLTNNIDIDELPSVSLDGSMIDFEAARSGDWDIHIMNIDGSEQVNLTNNPEWDEYTSFPP